MAQTRRSQVTQHVVYEGRHRFEHWYRDNQVYFITARCRDRFPAFACHEAKAIFWDRFDHYAGQHTFTPIITTLLDNHYHALGYLKVGIELGEMMRKLHGSVAKLVNDLLERDGGPRRVPFWHDKRHHDYFDGCLRDEQQFRLTYAYVRAQAVRHRIATRWQDYPHTRINVDCERALKRAVELKALLWGVPYKRYQQR
jgi:REP element-mobilizing transposase RayT